MGKSFHPIFCILISILTISYAQDCNTYSFSKNNVYATCVTLPVLNSQLHWNYHPTNATVDVAYRQTGVTNSQWVAWALNLGGSVGMVDFATGQTSGDGGNVGGSRRRRRNTHGVLNALSWGVMMPMGAMAARYLKVFKAANPAWFYIHVTCQASAYVIGVAGWGTGLKLGSDSTGIKYNTHRNIGIALFTLGTLQAKTRQQIQILLEHLHHSMGYTVILLSIINVFKGFDILDPENKWKKVYIGMLIFLAVNTVMLEAYTSWFIVLKSKQEEKKAYPSNGYSQSA
ncbi:hypothetical protein L1987_31756 [Smallanthus sonchifolius]|uniref:Uncharacterized protein n=1 Tax=Smallanthus sonchifolius TaxID=185202 RepID=A0ACB9I885_9ASTR|nr:hypothetical protein L1987_31756 [Smallanthus sonchifolius]